MVIGGATGAVGGFLLLYFIKNPNDALHLLLMAAFFFMNHDLLTESTNPVILNPDQKELRLHIV